MKLLRALAAWLLALAVLVWRRTCRYQVHHDPRPQLRAGNRPYAYALLHAHQVAAVFVTDERLLAAMVSRSADGDLLVPSLRLRRVRAVRGSTHKGGTDKGGRQALAELQALVVTRIPVLFAVDGPRGPRNRVHRGIADLALASNATILPTLVLPSRRWFLRRTWDRMQVPKPFCTIRLIFGEPIEPTPGSDSEHVRLAVQQALAALEAEYDPSEHARVVL